MVSGVHTEMNSEHQSQDEAQPSVASKQKIYQGQAQEIVETEF